MLTTGYRNTVGGKMENYLDILERELNKRGYKRNTENEALSKCKNGHVFSKEEHLKGLIYAQLSNQRPWEGIVPHFSEIDGIFFAYNYDEIKKHQADYFESKIRSINCGNRSIGAQMSGLHHNITVFEQIIKEYGSMDAFVNSETAYNIVRMISKNDSKYKLIQMGEALAWEYIRNVGIDGAKPDLHLRRFFGNTIMGLSIHEMAPINVVLSEVDRLSEETGRTKFEIDYILWTCMSQGIMSERNVMEKVIAGKEIKTKCDEINENKMKAKSHVDTTEGNQSDLMTSDLFTFDQAVERMDAVGLSHRVRKDEKNFRQFGEGCSSLHVKTKRAGKFMLYSTDSDFTNIRREAQKNGYSIVYLETTETAIDQKTIEDMVENIRENHVNTLIFVRNGNRLLHSNSEMSLPHKIFFFTNENFEFVINVLAMNELNCL